MKTRRSIYNQKKNKSKYIWISVGAVLLIGVIIGGIYVFSLKDVTQPEGQEELQDKNPKSDELTEKTNEKQPEKGEESYKDSNEETGNKNENNKPEKSDDKVVDNSGYDEGQKLPKEPTYINGVMIANKKYPLPKDYAPGEDPETRKAFEKMAADAKKAGFELTAFSTYRSYEYQETLYSNYVAKDGKENADRYSARPGYSEHQTGLAMDIGEVGREDLWLTEEFGETPAGQWLFENAVNYGFILRFPKGKENITGYMYESWHYRYLGKDLAKKVKDSGLTLEEYLGIE